MKKKRPKKEEQEEEAKGEGGEEEKEGGRIYLKAPPGGRTKVHPPAPSITHTHSYVYTKASFPRPPLASFIRLVYHYSFSLLEFETFFFPNISYDG